MAPKITLSLVCVLALAACADPARSCTPLTDGLCAPETAAEGRVADKVPGP